MELRHRSRFSAYRLSFNSYEHSYHNAEKYENGIERKSD